MYPDNLLSGFIRISGHPWASPEHQYFWPSSSYSNTVHQLTRSSAFCNGTQLKTMFILLYGCCLGQVGTNGQWWLHSAIEKHKRLGTCDSTKGEW